MSTAARQARSNSLNSSSRTTRRSAAHSPGWSERDRADLARLAGRFADRVFALMEKEPLA